MSESSFKKVKLNLGSLDLLVFITMKVYVAHVVLTYDTSRTTLVKSLNNFQGYFK